MNEQPAAEETEMDTTANRARLIAACDTDASAIRDDLRSRLERASRPARRIVEMLPVD